MPTTNSTRTYNKAAKGMFREDGSVGYGTPSGRLELAPMLYQYWGLSTTPFHTEPPEGPISTPELMEEYPLILTCGGRSFEFFHSEHRQLPTMRELHPQPRVLVNPATAEKYGIADGQWVWIENDHGRFKQIAKVSPVVNEKTVHAEHGWWFPETEGAAPYLFGTFESNPNNCTKAFVTGQGGVGSPIKGMICKIYPVREGDTMPYEQIAADGQLPLVREGGLAASGRDRPLPCRHGGRHGIRRDGQPAGGPRNGRAHRPEDRREGGSIGEGARREAGRAPVRLRTPRHASGCRASAARRSES